MRTIIISAEYCEEDYDTMSLVKNLMQGLAKNYDCLENNTRIVKGKPIFTEQIVERLRHEATQ